MSTKKKRHTSRYKFKVALEAAKESQSLSQLASEYEWHPSQISQWKRQLLEQGASVFESKQSTKQASVQAAQEQALYEQIGRLQMELEWLKKKSALTVTEKRALIEPAHPTLSIRAQCALLGLNRASYYYEPAQCSEADLMLMRLIDAQYLKTTFYGRRRMTAYLRSLGYEVNVKRVRRLMALMGIQALYPKPRTSVAHPDHGFTRICCVTCV